MEKYMRKYFRYIIASIIFTFSFMFLYEMVGNKQAIQRDTKITREVTFSCGEKETTHLPVLPQWIGMGFDKFAANYPKSQGWLINENKAEGLFISKAFNGLCKKHKNYRHLGISEGYMTVYEGPLGYDQKILQTESVKVQALPVETQKELESCMKFNKQPREIKERLQQSYEFHNEEELNSAMENFDEFRD